METVQDFEDMLTLLERREARYLIIGGLAFIYHAKPRFTKDIDLWVDPAADNVACVNAALAEFGSPQLLDPARPTEILQVGIAPNRIDLLRIVEGCEFQTAWSRRIRDVYGEAPANWMDLDTLLAIKERIAAPRHQDDARVLREVKALPKRKR